MKFKNINSGVVLAPNSEFVIEQLKKSQEYIEFKEEAKKENKKAKEILEETKEESIEE